MASVRTKFLVDMLMDKVAEIMKEHLPYGCGYVLVMSAFDEATAKSNLKPDEQRSLLEETIERIDLGECIPVKRIEQ